MDSEVTKLKKYDIVSLFHVISIKKSLSYDKYIKFKNEILNKLIVNNTKTLYILDISIFL